MISEFFKAWGRGHSDHASAQDLGKTLNMSMLAEFLDITKSSEGIFENTEIMQTCFAKEMNQYPVIFLSFKDAKGNRKLLVKQVKLALLAEYQRFSCIFTHLPHIEQVIYERTLQELLDYNTGSLSGIDNALYFLSKTACNYYERPVILLIDEYDTPFWRRILTAFIRRCTVNLQLCCLLH